MREINTIDEKRKAELDRVSANVHYEIARNFTEKDAEATIRAIVEKYPGLVMKVLSSEYIRNLAALEAMSGFMGRWKL
jgi:predicted ArsR family transcriptional regulator